MSRHNVSFTPRWPTRLLVTCALVGPISPMFVSEASAAEESSAETPASSAGADETVQPYIAPGGESDRRLHLALRTSLQYQVFEPALGGSVRLGAYWPLWNSRRVTGSVDVGLLFGYAYGGKFMYPWISEDEVTQINGSDQNFTTAVSVGHTFHLGKKRRSSLGVHVITGVNVERKSWSQTWLREDLSGSDTTTFAAFTFGPEVDYQFRFSRRVGFNLMLGGTCPCLPNIAGNFVRAGAGITVYLR